MAQPQGLNVPAIILTGVVSTILIAATVEGVRAYYFYTLSQEEAAKWAQSATPLAAEVKQAQVHTIKFEGTTPIDAAMKQVVANKGAVNVTGPATRPTTGPATKPSKP
jgi:hypothetical protein